MVEAADCVEGSVELGRNLVVNGAWLVKETELCGGEKVCSAGLIPR